MVTLLLHSFKGKQNPPHRTKEGPLMLGVRGGEGSGFESGGQRDGKENKEILLLHCQI